MKRVLLILGLLTALAALAEALILLQMRFDPSRLLPRVALDPWFFGALLESLALLLGAFVGLTQSGLVRQLRQWAVASHWAAFGMPFLLVVPYLVYALGAGAFSFPAAGKIVAYIAVPTFLLLPDRMRRLEGVGWRDLAAMLALALPVQVHWFQGVWSLPQQPNAFRLLLGIQDLYFFQPLFCVCVGAYAFMVVRNLEGVGYRLLWRKGDAIDGLANFAAFSLLGIPLGIFLGFLHPHVPGASLWDVPVHFVGTYLTIAIPEELLFRGLLQNILVRSIRRGPRGLYGLLIASVVFGASHLYHAPGPNWKYAILATLAGIFYGNAYRNRQRISASALTHALVDTAWHFWF